MTQFQNSSSGKQFGLSVWGYDKYSVFWIKATFQGRPDVIIEDLSIEKKVQNRQTTNARSSKKVGQIRKIQQLLNHHVQAQYQEGLLKAFKIHSIHYGNTGCGVFKRGVQN